MLVRYVSRNAAIRWRSYHWVMVEMASSFTHLLENKSTRL